MSAACEHRYVGNTCPYGCFAERPAASMDELMAATEVAERELLVACNALYVATDEKVADDVKAKARAVIEAHTAFNRALAANQRTGRIVHGDA